MTDLIQRCRNYAIKCHDETNHQYNGKPYSYHLQMVFEYGEKYIHLLSPTWHDLALAACWTHDVIEDCRQTYHDVWNMCGVEIAEITYALTNEKGKNRMQRADDKYYEAIRSSRAATFVKLCDRLANVKYSADNNHSMIKAYKKEHQYFTLRLFNIELKPMFDELNQLLSGVPEPITQ